MEKTKKQLTITIDEDNNLSFSIVGIDRFQAMGLLRYVEKDLFVQQMKQTERIENEIKKGN